MDEKAQFCGTICLDSAKLGFLLKRNSREGKTQFVFRDMLTGSVIGGSSKEDEKEALFDSCNQLVDKYLTTNNGKS